MLKDITIGQYYPGSSFVHKLDPRIKLIIGLIYMIGLFMINSFTLYGVTFILMAVVIKITEIPMKVFIKGLKPLRFILIITFVINMIFTPGDILFSIGPVNITSQGLTVFDDYSDFTNGWT